MSKAHGLPLYGKIVIALVLGVAAGLALPTSWAATLDVLVTLDGILAHLDKDSKFLGGGRVVILEPAFDDGSYYGIEFAHFKPSFGLRRLLSYTPSRPRRLRLGVLA